MKILKIVNKLFRICPQRGTICGGDILPNCEGQYCAGNIPPQRTNMKLFILQCQYIHYSVIYSLPINRGFPVSQFVILSLLLLLLLLLFTEELG